MYFAKGQETFMQYQSTRNKNLTANSLQAVLRGIAPDGGLYVPCVSEKISFDWKCVLQEDTLDIAKTVLSTLLPEYENMPELVRRAYAHKFETPDLTPLTEVGDACILELFRGPTAAFKDVALSMLPQLLCAAKRQLGDNSTTVILTATSGDTGKAALQGFCDVPGTRIIVFYPQQGVSAVQKAQMVTQTGNNVTVCAVQGNFDDAQTGVKTAFATCAGMPGLQQAGITFSSANSINIGRLAPQVVYYFKAYTDLVRRGRIRPGDPVDFAVPTGNFGDILAGHLAKIMGLPVGTLVCASNANNVLTEFFATGVYDRRRPFYKTASPSMDILVSSNLERLLYFVTDGETEAVAGWMRQLQTEGHYRISDSVLKRLQGEYWAGYCEDTAAAASISTLWKDCHYLCDTHTAVAWNVAQQYRAAKHPENPLVVLSTASPYKFPAAVLAAVGGTPCENEFETMEALQHMTGVPIPGNLQGLAQRPVLHTDCIEPQQLTAYVLEKVAQC